MSSRYGHLTYCMNIHPGESLSEVWAALQGPCAAVKHRVAQSRPFGVGLRLANPATVELLKDGELSKLRAWLDEANMYVFTVNGFPYGTFHHAPVKESVYLPDWSSPERVAYTQRLVACLIALLPEGVGGSISTVPLGYGARQSEGQVAEMARNVLSTVLELWRLEQEFGKRITLALEPEPDCLLQTMSDVVSVFRKYFYSKEALAWLGARCGVGTDDALEICRRHLGVCVDTCHAAVEFESARDVFETLRQQGITVGKVQLSSGLRAPACGDETRAILRRFDEPVYLHQTVVRRSNGELVRYPDLGVALSSEHSDDAEWRVHFHVPLHVQDYGSLQSTSAFTSEVLALHAARPLTRHLEVETYTWDVLPEKPRNVVDSIAQELSWVQARLEQASV